MFIAQQCICHLFCFGGDESGDHWTSAYSGQVNIMLKVCQSIVKLGSWSWSRSNNLFKTQKKDQSLRYNPSAPPTHHHHHHP